LNVAVVVMIAFSRVMTARLPRGITARLPRVPSVVVVSKE